TENASLSMERSVVARCDGDGLSLGTLGNCRLQRITVAYNGGHGLDFRGRDIAVTHSIFVLNEGIGLNVTAASGASLSLQFDYNNVWGNRGGDYSGIHRSSSDISAAPEFADPESSNLLLSAISPCIEAGEFGATLGASENPAWNAGAQLGVALIRTDTNLGSVEARIRWDTPSLESLDGHIAWDYEWGFGRAEIASSLSGFERLRTHGLLAYSPSNGGSTVGDGLIPEFQIMGIMDGAASRWEAAGSLRIQGGTAALRIGGSYEGPTGVTRQEIDLMTTTFSLSGRATDLTFTNLGVGWETAVSLGSISPILGLDLRLVPNLRLTASTRWHLQDAAIRFVGQTYLQQLGTSSFSLDWSNGGSTRASVALHLRSGQFEDGEVRVSATLGSLEVVGSLGANSSSGPRCRLDVIIDTDDWFLPKANEPPIPAYSHAPFEPEAGELVKFDAAASHDPDDELDQIWWDFGDGGTAIGLVVEHAYQQAGDYTLELTVSDVSGAVTTLVETFHVHESQTTPVATFIWAPVSASGSRLQRALRAGDRILLDAADSFDPDGTIVEYGWDVQSDGVFDHTSPESQIVIDPLPAGTWPVTLRIVNQAGDSDAVMRVLTIEELKPPEAQFEISPAAPAVADPIRFVDRSIEWDGTILSWEWDFGDGDTSDEREPNHRYLDTGEFEVLLTVRDTEGLEATASQIITVRANPELVAVGRVWALLIGISNYLEVDDLSYADRDAKSMAEWLLTSGIPPTQIRLLTDQASSLDMATGDVLESSVATLVNVREGLGWLRQRASRDDLVLIHFSGHGYQGADDNLDERDGVDEFFVLHDTRAAAKDDTALRDDEFGRFLDRIESDHVLVFFDSCYSGGLSRSLTPGSRATGNVADVFSDFNLEGRLVLSASSENQDAFESPELQHGVLTHFLLTGLAGAGDLNDDGHITVWELFEYVRSEVPSFVESERGEKQFPQLIGEGESRVVLARPQSSELPGD
ncbi:PKD domain-containing protein, partial [Candidatus Bipolaricaulota bacterium]